MKNIFLSLFLILSLSGCKNKTTQPVDNQNDFATHFAIKNFDNYKILQVTEAWNNGNDYKYILAKNKKQIPDSLQKYTFIKIPVQRIVVTSTTHLPALELLNEADKLVGFPNTRYISSKTFINRLKSGKIQEIGNGASLNTEKTLLLKPDVIVAFSSGKDQKRYEFFEKHNIPVLFNADWMEKNPLGRSEWIKVFGVLFDKTKQAQKFYDETKSNYLKIKGLIKQKTNKPLVFQGGIFGDKWFVPGGKSYAVQLIKDAGGEYLWNDNDSQGSIKLNFENVLIKLPKADIWLNPGSIISRNTLATAIPQIKDLKVYKNQKIYTYNLKKGSNGGITYFETSTIHPDWVLADLYHIFYPDKTPNYHFHYYSVLLD